MAKKTKANKLSFWQRFAKDQEAGAAKGAVEELFQDLYSQRGRVYRMNFIRGLFFGFGSVLGGTLLIAFLIWVLSQLGAVVPFLSDFIQDILDALGQRTS